MVFVLWHFREGIEAKACKGRWPSMSFTFLTLYFHPLPSNSCFSFVQHIHLSTSQSLSVSCQIVNQNNTDMQRSIASSVSSPEEAPATPHRTSSFRLPWLAAEGRSPYNNTNSDPSPASPAPSSASSLNLQKLYPISPAMLSVQASSPNAQVMIQCTADAVSMPEPTSLPATSTSTKTLDLKKLWPISPAMLSYQSPHTQMSIRSAMSEQDMNRADPGMIQSAKPVKKGFKWR